MNKGVILAIDDAADSLKLLTQILGREGYTVRPADSGELGLASAVATPPDLILLDIRMSSSASRESIARLTGAPFNPFDKGVDRDKPGTAMDGFAVCHELKIRPETKDIPVIFLSGTTDNEERVDALRLGAVDFISKPFRPDELLARVKTHIELGRTRSGLKRSMSERTMHLKLAHESVDIPLQEAVAARDWPLVVRLFEPTALMMFGFQGPIHDWLVRLPAEAIEAEPGLAFWRAYTLVGIGRLVAAETYASAADARLSEVCDQSEPDPDDIHELARLRSLRSRIAGWRGHVDVCLDMAQEGLRLASDGTPVQIAIGHHWLGLAYIMVGKPREAAEHFRAVTSLLENVDGPQRWLASVGYCWYGRSLYMQGRLNDALDVCHQAVAIEKEHGGPAVDVTFALEADILVSRRQTTAARQAIERAVDLNGPFEQWFCIPVTWLAAARFYFCHGSGLAGDDAVDNLVEWARRNNCSGVRDTAEAVRVNHWLATGQIERTWLWAVERSVDVDAQFTFQDEPALMSTARAMLHHGRVSGDLDKCRKAVSILRRLRAAAEADFRYADAMVAGVSEALALEAVGDVEGAVACLEPWIDMGVREGYYCVFHDEGDPMLALLQRAFDKDVSAEAARELIATFGNSDSLTSILPPAQPVDAKASQLVNPLTDREAELLKLIAAGLTNAELAETLFITGNTVKTHIKHLFQKLGVSTRTEAVARARSVGLLG